MIFGIIPPDIDWAQIMVDLREHGCTAYRVKVVIGAADCTVRNWANGGEPGYGYGRALLRLHAYYCGAGLTILRTQQAEASTTMRTVTKRAKAA